jgi:ABC-type nitrate/sulfonate/bicarbonate transport system permease component
LNKPIFRSVISIAAFTAFLVLWEAASKIFFSSSSLFPGPLIVFEALSKTFASGELASDLASSAVRVAAGLVIGGFFGILFGVLTATIKTLNLTLGQIANFLRGIPSIAFVPLAVVWLGIGEMSKVFLVSWSVVFPVWVNTHHGIMQTDKHYVWAVKSLGASKLQTLKEVILPSALPFIIVGVRLGISMAFIALVAAEMAGSFSGIGYRISASHFIFRVDKMIAGIVMLGATCFLADRVYLLAIKRRFPWIKPVE